MSKATAILGFILTFVGGYFVGVYSSGGSTSEGGDVALAPGDSGTERIRVPVGLSPSKGPKDAKVTLIEYSDFQCPFCSRVIGTIADLEKEFKGQLRVVFKHNPLPMHPDAPLAAEASLAANEQGKFWEMHDKLFQNQKALKRENLESYAKEIGLDVERFKKALDEGRFKRQVEADKNLAQQIGSRGTPAFYINGRPLSGAQPKDAFAKIIREEIAYADSLIKKGTPAGRVYAEIMRSAKMSPGAQAPGQAPTAAGGRANEGELYKVPVGNSPFKGAKDAKVTIIEYSDFQCPFCSRVVPTVKQIMDAYKGQVKFVFKHNALPFHNNAKAAAQAAIAAQKQGKFWEMHDKLFENQKALDAESLKKYAKELGLNMSKFERDMADPSTAKQIEEEMAIANKLGARGTPAFFVNGRYMRGAAPFEKFKTFIDEELKKADDLVKKGTPLARVYDELTKTGLTEAKAGPMPTQGGPRPGQPDPATRYRVDIKGAPAKGPRDAKVTIVEFSDFQCPFCSRVGPTLKQIHETWPKDVKVVFMQNPLPFHNAAMPAAIASLAAHRQGKFWEMHDKLFENQKALDAESLKKYAQEIGLNVSKFERDSADPALKAEAEAQQKAGAQVGARGTPAFFINGKFLSGAQPFEAFKAKIEEELKAAEDLIKKGVPVGKVYDTLMKEAKGEVAAAAPMPPGVGPALELKKRGG